MFLQVQSTDSKGEGEEGQRTRTHRHILRGQQVFCKHLYSVVISIMINNLRNSESFE